MRRVCLALLLLLPLMLLPALGAEVSFSQADELLEAAEDYGVDPRPVWRPGCRGSCRPDWTSWERCSAGAWGPG